MKIEAKDLHCVAILASYWLAEHDKRFFQEEIEATTKLRRFCSQFEDDDKIIIEKEKGA